MSARATPCTPLFHMVEWLVLKREQQQMWHKQRLDEDLYTGMCPPGTLPPPHGKACPVCWGWRPHGGRPGPFGWPAEWVTQANTESWERIHHGYLKACRWEEYTAEDNPKTPILLSPGDFSGHDTSESPSGMNKHVQGQRHLCFQKPPPEITAPPD